MTVPITDDEIDLVEAYLRSVDPLGTRTATVLRNTIDQLYDGQRTGRYKWDQLYKTEKTHCGTLVEINLQREFRFDDGHILDFRIEGVEVDCKYSQRSGGWMIPPEARGQICIVVTAADTAEPVWSLGLVRASEAHLNLGNNRDSKATLNASGRDSIRWLSLNRELPPNVLLQLSDEIVNQIMSATSGVRRVNELFRSAQKLIIRRTVVATVAQQDDYMKRVRTNGGARSSLKPEGILILGQYESHARIATQLNLPRPGKGDFVSARVVSASNPGEGVAIIGNSLWRVASDQDKVEPAPDLPKI